MDAITTEEALAAVTAGEVTMPQDAGEFALLAGVIASGRESTCIAQQRSSALSTA